GPDRGPGRGPRCAADHAPDADAGLDQGGRARAGGCRGDREREVVPGRARATHGVGDVVHRAGSRPDPGPGQRGFACRARDGRPSSAGDEETFRARGRDRSGLGDDVVQHRARARLDGERRGEHRGPAPPDVGEEMTVELMILAITLVAGLYVAWTIGANDVANAMGTSVGSGALTL